jgi:hypothetical protein
VPYPLNCFHHPNAAESAEEHKKPSQAAHMGTGCELSTMPTWGWTVIVSIQSDFYSVSFVCSPSTGAGSSVSYICAVQHIRFSHIPLPHSIWHTLSDVIGCFRLRTAVDLVEADELTTASASDASGGLATSSGWMVAEWMP